MGNVTTVGIDLAANVFSVHGVDASGREVLRRTVRLMAPKFVAPYCKSGKNDGDDAEAICEAVARPGIRRGRSTHPQEKSVRRSGATPECVHL